MTINLFLLVLTVVAAYHPSFAHPSDVLQTSGYTFYENSKGYYKSYSLEMTWHDAQERCEYDRGQLFVPESEAEAEGVGNLLNLTNDSFCKWVEISNLEKSLKSEFETFDGRPLNEVYHKWHSMMPEPEPFVSDYCLCLNTNENDYGLLPRSCDSKRPFICEINPTRGGNSRRSRINPVTAAPIKSTTIDTITDNKPCDETHEHPRDEVTGASTSHVHFGNLIGEELKPLPRIRKINMMVSMLKMVQDYWTRKQEDDISNNGPSAVVV